MNGKSIVRDRISAKRLLKSEVVSGNNLPGKTGYQKAAAPFPMAFWWALHIIHNDVFFFFFLLAAPIVRTAPGEIFCKYVCKILDPDRGVANSSGPGFIL